MINKYTLINLILEAGTTDAEKDDAIIELGEQFRDSETINFLVELSNNEKIDEMLSSSCGESIAQIWLNNNHIEYDKLLQLKGVALNEVLSIVESKRPDWYEVYLNLKKEQED